MTSKDAALYGIHPKKKTAAKEITSSSTLAFTSQLSTLIAASKNSSSKTAPGRKKPKQDDIFATHNKNVRKRAAKDLDEAEFEQKHSTSSAPLDDSAWHRSKRKMEEKARLYAAMKRGDIEDVDGDHLVDFDAKWAEQEARGDVDKDTSSDDGADSEEELVEYTDEFGRSRRGTRADVAINERRKRMMEVDTPDRYTARPMAPSNIIFGDTIQSAAFNPDEPIAMKMAELAAKRDKEPTPPPDEHFDSRKEIRTKGMGFFQFSADEETRKKEMEALTKEREDTERSRKERERRKEERRKQVEERKKVIQDKRGKAQATKFLADLSEEMFKGE